jgi:DNA-binding NarL/FixJ family response regulator
MEHWIVDREAAMLASWQQAMPAAKVFRRSEIAQTQSEEPGIVWCRLRSGEKMDVILDLLPVSSKQLLVVLSDEPDESLVMQALANGAVGCCNTHAAPEVLEQVVSVVANGGLWVGQTLLKLLVGSASRVLAERNREHQRDDWSQLLSEREVQVARLVAAGASNKEVASQLSITERTVKAHLGAIFEKLSLRDRLQLSVRINGVVI